MLLAIFACKPLANGLKGCIILNRKKRGMFYYSKDRVTARTVLDTRRAKGNGKYPIKIAVGYRRKVKYYQTGKDATPEQWEGLPTARGRELAELREDLEASFGIVRDYIKKLTAEGDFTFEALNARLLGATSDTINTAVKQRAKRLAENGQISTSKIYRCLLRTLERYAGDNIKFADVTPKWLRGYERHEIERGAKLTTIGIYLRSLRVVISEAVENGNIKPSADPFGRGRFEIKNGEGRKLALTTDQIGQIARFECSPRKSMYRDYWLFMYLCNGINPKDLTLLKWSNIENGEIYFVRQKTRNRTKTEQVIRAIITPKMWEIIEKWGNKPSADGYIFPILNKFIKAPEKIYDKQFYFMVRVNRCTNWIGERLGIGRITTYTARHSFATVLKRSGANIAYISESLGHTNIKTTANYLASFEREEREKNALLLEQF